jgi:hypothetical protein
LNTAIGAGVFLQGLGFEVDTNPLKLIGQLSLSAGPQVAGKTAVTFKGGMTAVLADPWIVEVDGSAKLADRFELGNAFLRLSSNGLFEIGGHVHWSLDVVYVDGSVSGWVAGLHDLDVAGAVSALRLTRNGSTVTLAWRATVDGFRHAAYLTLSDGRRILQLVPAGRHSVSIRDIAPTTGVTASVTGLTAGNTKGAAARASLKPTPSAALAARIRQLLVASLAPRGNSAKLSALLSKGSRTVSFVAPVAGRLSIVWLAPSAHGRAVVVATGSHPFRRAAAAAVAIKLTARGRRLLANAHAFRLAATGSFAPAGQAGVTATRAFTLKR